MRRPFAILAIVLVSAACHGPTAPTPPDNSPMPTLKLIVLATGDRTGRTLSGESLTITVPSGAVVSEATTLRTDSNGLVMWTVSEGQYIVQARDYRVSGYVSADVQWRVSLSE